MANPIARKLYLRIWLAVAGSVAVLSVLAGLGWKVAEEQREREREHQAQAKSTRDVLVRNASGALIGTAEAHHEPGQAIEFVVTLDNGQELTLQMSPPRLRGGVEQPAGAGAANRSDITWAWLRPPYGFLWGLTLAGLVVMVGVFPVARRLTTRLELLQRGVQRWGEGDLSARLPEDGQDEVAYLSRRFNAAAARISHLMESQNALLRSQKSLLANASHELRSPLARIRMALELVAGQGSGAARDEISRNIVELNQLVDEILLASRLDAREADLGVIEQVDLIGLLAEECSRVGATLELAGGTARVVVPGVVKLLRRAVRNLLENAVRHGSSSGRGNEVSAELRLEGGQAVLDVDDRGPGVPPDQRQRIFEPFYRLPGASERAGGVGLGLALVKSIAERHRGQVSCTNREGGGARFTLSLPTT